MPDSLQKLGWLAVISAPILIFWLMDQHGADQQVTIFTVIAITTLLMWVFSLVSDFIPALLALLSLLLFGLAPESVILSGFSSSAFLLAFSMMGLGAAIVESGLARRYTLILLKHLPTNTFTHQLAIFFTGSLFTPVVPSIIGRGVIVGPVVKQVVEGWDDETRQRSSTMIYSTGLDSIHYLAPIFLTAAPANLMIYALLPAQEQQAYHFLFWAFAASVTGIALLIFYFACSALFFRSAYRHIDIVHANIDQALRELGPITANERIALFGIMLLTVGIATISIHKIEVHYLALMVLSFLLYLGALERKDFIAKIDWAFLMLLAGMIGVLATMKHLQIDDFLAQQLGWLSLYMRQDFLSFVLALTATTVLIRLFIPLNQAILILAAALLPIASHSGIAPWVVGFIILVIAETSFFAYQAPYIFLFRTITQSVQRDEWRVSLFHALLLLFKVVAIIISIPFWREIGVI